MAERPTQYVGPPCIDLTEISSTSADEVEQMIVDRLSLDDDSLGHDECEREHSREQGPVEVKQEPNQEKAVLAAATQPNKPPPVCKHCQIVMVKKQGSILYGPNHQPVKNPDGGIQRMSPFYGCPNFHGK